MAWARPPGAYQLPSCPIELLEDRPYQYNSLLEIYGLPSLITVLFSSPHFLYNMARKRPLYTGIWRGAILAVVGCQVGLWARDFRRSYLAEDREVQKAYMRAHPEDFPPYERKLIKDLFLPWRPIR